MLSRAGAITRIAAVLLLPLTVRAATSNLNLDTINTIFSFGDSLTTTGYNIVTQPLVLDTKLLSGLMDLDKTTIKASISGGRAWVQYFAENSTNASTSYYNFASLATDVVSTSRAGATVDNSIVYSNGAVDFVNQVVAWKTYFNSTNSPYSWSPSTSLFTIWFGNDDLYNLIASGQDFKQFQSAIMTALDTLVGQLYAAGAKNVALMDIPALYHSPLAAYTNGEAILQDDISYWNDRLQAYASNLADRYSGIQAYYISSESFTNVLIASPEKYGFVNNATSCSAYSTIVFNPNATDIAACGVPMFQYIWKDFWRPTWPVHELFAKNVASVLSKNSSTIGDNTPSVNAGLVAQNITTTTSSIAPTATATAVVSSESSLATTATTMASPADSSAAEGLSTTAVVTPSKTAPTPSLIPQASGQGQNLTSASEAGVTSPMVFALVTALAALFMNSFL
ncbi:BQ5605_C039g11751 [Microbotryum silenes-dioicae]|uniref:BQ5605_C039g11751 protein n=1 Tax=Microbotryum silenes-dioicae TaxID=796604 RepID=A0A2X0ME64_9BASI|nr:BQ5605_C039g11751 [Microbotryum silenes-dioicae]